MAEAKKIPTRDEVAPGDRWNLSLLYLDDGLFEADLLKLEPALARVLAYKGSLAESKEKLLGLLGEIVAMGRLEEKLFEYASLRQSEDEGNSVSRDRYGRLMMIYSAAQAECAWIDPEIQAIPDGKITAWMEDDAFVDYRVWLKKLLRFKPHVLSESEERILALHAEVAATSQQAFSVLTNVDLSFGTIDAPEGPRELSQGSFSWFLHHADSGVRWAAYDRFYTVFEEHKNVLAQLYQGSVLDDCFGAQVRKHPSARAEALFPDAVDESVYDNLISTVNEYLPVLRRYYGIKKRALGRSAAPGSATGGILRHCDVYAPIVPDVRTDYPWDTAVSTICDALAPLGTEYVSTFRQGLSGGWADRYENKGKRSGAFSSGSWEGQPYILMNYQSDVLRDLYTLAHEGGHSMHSWYSARSNPFLSYNYTIFEAEVASTFNEDLLFHHLLSKATDPAMRAYLLNMRVDDILATLFRQTMFAEFERRSHELVEGGQPLTADLCRAEYRVLLEKYFGPDVELDPRSDLECLRIPHFYRAFYVYKYSTGISASLALSKRVREGGEKEREDYFSFLRSGGSRYPVESLKLAGVDMATPGPVRAACETFGALVDELAVALGIGDL